MSGSDFWMLVFAFITMSIPLLVCIFLVWMLVRAIRHGNWRAGAALLANFAAAFRLRRTPPNNDHDA
ncbi:MAG: hypothetical protein QM769_15015 [Pseudoxanthomonas sp.]